MAGGFPRYISCEERQRKNQWAAERLGAARELLPASTGGRRLARSWWGRMWNENIRRFAEDENRLTRGRSYLRDGAVLDLRAEAGRIEALVQGSRKNPYRVEIKVAPLDEEKRSLLYSRCARRFKTPEGITGGSPEELAALFAGPETGLFPSEKEISLDCGCPDWARMCKHVAAALLGMGFWLDEDPLLLFLLRGVEPAALLRPTLEERADEILGGSRIESQRILGEEQVHKLFHI